MPRKTAPTYTFEFGQVTETIFINGDMDEATFDHLINFCIDKNGNTRRAMGVVNSMPGSDDDINYVPRERFEIQANPWNAHQQYVEITLPNPAQDFAYYQKIRSAFIEELQKRVPTLTLAVPTAVTFALDGP